MERRDNNEYWNRMAEKSLSNTYNSDAPPSYLRKIRGPFGQTPKSHFSEGWSQAKIDDAIASIRSKLREGTISRAEYVNRMDQMKRIRNRS